MIAGNYYNKYETTNPIGSFLVGRFLKTIVSFAERCDASTVHEVGCGEGMLSSYVYANLKHKPRRFSASDISESIIDEARSSPQNAGIKFIVRSIYDLSQDESSDLIICCEVLEHLKNPKGALQKLGEIAKERIILSVPREPIWRMLNLCRLKYISDLGNTPGHIQHWSSTSLLRLINQFFSIEDIAKPLPWTILLCKCG
jgi:2-polyprenyl-3-methyl-5-hydroxy-6-metoxy-1,4-benzoquinol methylase